MSTHTKTIMCVVGVLLGIVVGEMSAYASEIAISAAILAVLQSILYVWGVRVERKRKERRETYGLSSFFSFPLVTILFSLGLSMGIIRTQLVEEKIHFVCENVCTFEGQIVSSPETKNAYQVLRVHPLVESEQLYDIQIRSTLYPKYEIGDTLKITGKVTLPEILFSHTNTTGNNRTFDYVSYLRTKNIGSEMIFPKIEIEDTEAHTLAHLLGRWKENLVTRIDSYVAQPASSLASGMLFGASSMSDTLQQTFRTAGLSHIIVLSGFNIVIVIASILFVLAFLPLIVRITLASLSVIIFVMMVGPSPSVVRATLMAFIALLAMITGRPYVAKQALILSLFVIVMYEPYALIHDVSLQLSFLATMGLVYMSESLELLFKKYIRVKFSTSFRELFITTLSAYFATLPYVMYTFGSVSLYALIANVLVVPFVPFAMFISFLVVLTSYISTTLSSLFGFMDTVFINVMIWVATSIEALPFSSFRLTLSLEGMLSFYLILFGAILFLMSREKNETGSTDKNGNLTDILSY